MSAADIILTDELLQLRAKRAAYMREWSRRKGVSAVKGEAFPCGLCGCAVIGKGSRPPKYCAGCKKAGVLADRSIRRIATGSEPVGTSKVCANCASAFVKVHKRQKYCEPCSELASKEALPSYRKRQASYQSARNKVRRAEIPSVAIRERMSAGIKNSLRDGKNGRSWEALAGYTVADLMRHLERQFLPGMTWGNRGDWHIDHIVPLSSFDFTSPDDPEFRAAWALTNLRPLWAKDNIRKSAKRTHLI